MEKVKKKAVACPDGARPMSIFAAILASFFAGVASGIFPSNFGGVFFLCISIGLLGYVLTVSYSPWYIVISAVSAVLVAYLAGVGIPVCAVSLIHIAPALVLAYSVRSKRFLTPTVASTLVAFLSFVAVFALLLYICMGEEFTSTVGGAVEEYKAYFIGMLEKANSMYPADKMMAVDDIKEMVTIMVMLLPAMSVLLCMLVCYLSAKVLKLAATLCSNDCLFRGGVWPVSAALSGSVVFVLSLVATAFSGSSDVAFYAGLTIMLLFLPAQAITGFKLMFGKRGFFRMGSFTTPKLVMMGIFVFLVISNPFMAVVYAGIFTSLLNFKFFIITMMAKRKDK